MSRIIQTKAIWKTESPNCEKNCAAQRSANGAGPSGPRPADSAGLSGSPWLTPDARSGLLMLPRPELGRAVLEIPHERGLDAQRAEERVELAPVMQMLVEDD